MSPRLLNWQAGSLPLELPGKPEVWESSVSWHLHGLCVCESVSVSVCVCVCECVCVCVYVYVRE